MFSKTVLVVFAVNFIFAGSANEAFMPAVLAPAMKCFEAGNSAVVAVLQAMQDRPETDVDRINLSCLFCKVIYLAKALKIGTYPTAYQETRPRDTALQCLHEEMVANESRRHTICATHEAAVVTGTV